MMKFSIKDIDFIPAGHEDPQRPGAFKKTIVTAKDIQVRGTLQMMNWAIMDIGKHFRRHYHENMHEIFLIISGRASITIDHEQTVLEATDTVYIPLRAEHEMENIGKEPLVYIAVGIVEGVGGKTVIVEHTK